MFISNCICFLYTPYALYTQEKIVNAGTPYRAAKSGIVHRRTLKRRSSKTRIHVELTHGGINTESFRYFACNDVFRFDVSGRDQTDHDNELLKICREKITKDMNKQIRKHELDEKSWESRRSACAYFAMDSKKKYVCILYLIRNLYILKIIYRTYSDLRRVQCYDYTRIDDEKEKQTYITNKERKKIGGIKTFAPKSYYKIKKICKSMIALLKEKYDVKVTTVDPKHLTKKDKQSAQFICYAIIKFLLALFCNHPFFQYIFEHYKTEEQSIDIVIQIIWDAKGLKRSGFKSATYIGGRFYGALKALNELSVSVTSIL